MDNTIKITMFKDFTLEYQNQVIVFDKIATRQMTSLLQILIHHKQGISKDDLIKKMWQDNANPLNALKYSIFRLRATLNEIEAFQGLELISTIKNGYIFAPNFKIVTDYTLLDSQYRIMNDATKTKKEIIKSAEVILSLYKGQFFLNDFSTWGMQVRSYYQNIYEKAFMIICDDYIDRKKENDVLAIVQKAIEINKFFDDAYVYQLKALIGLGEINKAKQLYKQVNELYENEFNHSLSPKFKFMNTILSAKKEPIHIVFLKNKLHETMDATNALLCDFETFKFIYHMKINNTSRDTKKDFMLIFQLASSDDKTQSRNMTKLKTIMCHHLRNGDVLSKFNNSQIVALLPCDSIENANRIMHRITSAFYKKVHKDSVKLHHYISSLSDFSETILLDNEIKKLS